MPNLGFGGLPKVSRPPRLPAIAGSNRPPLAVREGEKDGMTSLPQEKMDFWAFGSIPAETIAPAPDLGPISQQTLYRKRLIFPSVWRPWEPTLWGDASVGFLSNLPCGYGDPLYLGLTWWETTPSPYGLDSGTPSHFGGIPDPSGVSRGWVTYPHRVARRQPPETGEAPPPRSGGAMFPLGELRKQQFLLLAIHGWFPNREQSSAIWKSTLGKC